MNRIKIWWVRNQNRSNCWLFFEDLGDFSVFWVPKIIIFWLFLVSNSSNFDPNHIFLDILENIRYFWPAWVIFSQIWQKPDFLELETSNMTKICLCGTAVSRRQISEFLMFLGSKKSDFCLTWLKITQTGRKYPIFSKTYKKRWFGSKFGELKTKNCQNGIISTECPILEDMLKKRRKKPST